MKSDGVVKYEETDSEYLKIDNLIFKTQQKIIISKKEFKPLTNNDLSFLISNENKSYLLKDEKSDLFSSYSKISKLQSENSNFLANSAIFSDQNTKKVEEKHEASKLEIQVETNNVVNRPSSEVSLKKIQESEKKIQEVKKYEIEEKKPDITIAHLCSLVKFFNENLKFCLHLYKHDQAIQILSSDISRLSPKEISEISPLICGNCQGLLIEVPLLCGHNTCKSCFSKNLFLFLSSPSLPTLKQLSCKVCSLNYELWDIEKYSESLSQFKSINLQLHCERCNNNFKAVFNYWAESPCFHLCASCYADLIMVNVTSCLYCNRSFHFRNSTLQRFSFCETCQVFENSVFKCHRNVLGFKCFPCLQRLAIETSEKGLILKIARYINKTCFFCGNIFSICDMQFRNCEHIACEDCSSIPENLCSCP
jgi:hypothetical protein